MKKYNLSNIMKRAWELVKKGRSLHLRRIEISMEGSKEHGRNNGGKAYPPWL